ncbi:MAG TPA: ABC transporter permease [Solirubrobacteraceae bacterium]|nr:ABC transporter permease [Solirubrobacteraceae bacterium]
MTTQAVGRQYGPAAIEDDARRFLSLTLTLATTDFKLRYFGSALGYLWSLMRPLMLFGVLYVVFTQVFSLGKGVPHYPVYLLTGIILWTFFVETTSNNVQSLVVREGLLRKMRFPRLVIPLSVALVALFNLGMNMIAVVVFALANGVYPHWSWLEMPVLIVLLGFLAVGVGMLLSALYVRYRDIQPIWDVVSQALFYASPVIYTAFQYKTLKHVAMFNPIGAILTQMHYSWVGGGTIVRDGHAYPYVVHDAATTAGGAVFLLVPLAIILGLFCLGLWFFTREAPRIAENL